MDANETTTPKGRSTQLKKGETIYPHANMEKSEEMSTMACHFQNMTDAHRKMNPDWYDPSTRDPLETAMTSKCKNQNGNISKAKLDLALISITVKITYEKQSL